MRFFRNWLPTARRRDRKGQEVEREETKAEEKELEGEIWRRSKESDDEDDEVEEKEDGMLKNFPARHLVGISCLGFGAFALLAQQSPVPGNPLVSPLSAPSAVASLRVNDPDRFWGTYRSGFYFGMKTKAKQSLVAGLMWLEQYVKPNSIPGEFVRHKCNDDNKVNYNWDRHDGVYFGEQTIIEDKFDINTKYVKRPDLGTHGGDWTWRIEATSKVNIPKAITFMVYFATDHDGSIERVMSSSDEDKLDEIVGETSTLGKFNVQFFEAASKVISIYSYKENLKSLTDIGPDAAKRLGGDVQNSAGPYMRLKNIRTINQPTGREVIVYAITAELPLVLDVVFESESGSRKRRSTSTLTSNIFDAEFGKHNLNFEIQFLSKFNFAPKWTSEHKKFAREIAADSLGGISYFYGASCTRQEDGPIMRNWEAPLLTGVRSRSFSPRGSIFDEGFLHVMISKLNPNIAKDAMCHWLDLLNADGWIPKDVIMDDESRARVNKENVVQYNNEADPPSLFLVLDELISDGQLTNSDLDALYPRVTAWFDWFNATQYGPTNATYKWQGRYASDYNSELNPPTKMSGLEDYPRASHPTKYEYHLDLRCWITLGAEVIVRMGEILGKSDLGYRELLWQLKDYELLNKVHWDKDRRMYSDYGYHSDNVRLRKVNYTARNTVNHRTVREVLTEPAYKFVPHSGYVSLFPFFMKLIPEDSEKVGLMLDFMRDENKLWTKFGLRSLSKDDPLYRAPNTHVLDTKWRGKIWLNINFLAVRALEYYSSRRGAYSSRAKEIKEELKTNIVKNVYYQFKKTGSVWESYDENTGDGQGYFPHTGWSALVVLLMDED